MARKGEKYWRFIHGSVLYKDLFGILRGVSCNLVELYCEPNTHLIEKRSRKPWLTARPALSDPP